MMTTRVRETVRKIESHPITVGWLMARAGMFAMIALAERIFP